MFVEPCSVVSVPETGALVVVGSVVATAPPLVVVSDVVSEGVVVVHAVITSRAAAIPAGLNLIILVVLLERVAFT